MTKTDKPRQLTVQQQNAIDMLILGKSDREAAEAVGVSRQTVCTWRHEHAGFIAELNRRRGEVWSAHTDRLRQLVSAAVDVLEANLGSDDARLRQEAAVHVLKATGLYGANLAPSGPTDSEGVELERQMQAYGREVQRMATDPADLALERRQKGQDRRFKELMADLS